MVGTFPHNGICRIVFTVKVHIYLFSQVGVTFSAVSGVILYRIIVFAVMSMNPDHEAKANVRVTVTTTAVIINLLVVLVLDEIYGAIAAWITELGVCVFTWQKMKCFCFLDKRVTLTKKRSCITDDYYEYDVNVILAEIPKTESTFEEHVILKAFLLKSMNAFAPVFYVAFFKGR